MFEHALLFGRSKLFLAVAVVFLLVWRSHSADTMALSQEKIYTIDDIYALPDDERAELIDGQHYS